MVNCCVQGNQKSVFLLFYLELLESCDVSDVQHLAILFVEAETYSFDYQMPIMIQISIIHTQHTVRFDFVVVKMLIATELEHNLFQAQRLC